MDRIEATDKRLIQDADWWQEAISKMNENIQKAYRNESYFMDVISQILSSGPVYSGVIDSTNTPNQPSDGDIVIPANYQWFNSFYTGMIAVNLKKKMVFVKGYSPSGHPNYNPSYVRNIIYLGEPPNGTSDKTSSPNDPDSWKERSDLVYLEVYYVLKNQGDNIKENGNFDGTTAFIATAPILVAEWRLRTVKGVEFETYPDGINDSNKVKARDIRGAQTSLTYSKMQGDNVWYVAGDGSNTSKTILGTFDGKIYGLPMFRVDRRNSTPHNLSSNPNGALKYASTTLTAATSSGSDTISVASTQNMLAGKKIKINGIEKTIDSILSATSIKLTTTMGSVQPIGSKVETVSDREDGKFSNIIHKDDLIIISAGSQINYSVLNDIRKEVDEMKQLVDQFKDGFTWDLLEGIQ